MTSIKKIALIAAMAVTFGTLSVPAHATPPAPVGSVVSNPYLVPVPETGLVTNANVVDLTVTGLANNTAVSVQATNALVVSSVTTDVTDVSISAGRTILSGNSLNSTSVHIYAFTTKSIVGSVAVTVGGNTTTTYLQGIAGSLNVIGISTATDGAVNTSQKVTITGVDVFGNPVDGATVHTVTTTNGIAIASSVITDDKGAATFYVTVPATGSVSLVAYATVATAVIGLTAPVGSVTATINARDYASELAVSNALNASLNAQITALNAQIATLNGQIAGLTGQVVALNAQIAKATADGVVTTNELNRIKKLYNNLAKKWNVRHPKAKAALLK